MDFRSRIIKLRRLGRRLDTLLISDPADIFYYTGFQAGPDDGVLLAVREEPVLLLSPLNNCTEGLRCAHAFLRKKGDIKKWITGKVGYDERHLVVEQFLRLKKLHPHLSPAAATIKKPREVKDEEEIRLMEKACALDKRIIHELEVVGKTEHQLARDIRLLQLEQGAGQAFESIVATGRNTGYIHYRPRNRVVRKGDVVLLDLGSQVEGYCSDTTRTFILGENNRKELSFIEGVQQQLIEQLRPGAKVSELQQLYEKMLKKAGHRAAHLFGHGIGLEVHEPLPAELKAGMTLTVEPGIYRPGFGCRREDVVVVGKKPRML